MSGGFLERVIKSGMAGVALIAIAAGSAQAHTRVTPRPAVNPPVVPAAPAPAGGANAPLPSAFPPEQAPADLNAQDLRTFFSGLVPYMLKRGDIAGGVVVVVKDGQILLAQGYGYADVAKRKPVVADTTLFRVGSVSKLFIWTAVMQLVGEGKLDLDRNVNDYLDFRISQAFGRPITLRNCMTHTPGFEDNFSESFVKRPQQLRPLGDYLKRHIPARIYPPGKVVAYSNYCASMSGYIVQRVTGEPYDRYVAEHILAPLAMDHSSLQQPLPPALARHMSRGYTTADQKPVPFELIATAPAGALSATGRDMAHFMIAQLENGSYQGRSILSPAMIALMHSPQSRMAPDMNGFDLGFYQENRNGLRIIGHAGDTLPFHSDLHLLLDKDVGFFISVNSVGKEGEAERVRVGLFRAFLDRYFPYTPPPERTVADPKPDAARVAGWYGSSRRGTSAFRLLYGLSQTSVLAKPDGTIVISALKDLGGTPKTWREVAPLTYREVGGQTHTKFVTDSAGSVLYWISDDFVPVMVFQRVHGLRQLSLVKWLGSAALFVFVLTVAIWIGGAIARRHGHITLALDRRAFTWRLASRIGAVLLLSMFLGWVGLIAGMTATNTTMVDGWLLALYLLGALATLGAIAIVIEAAMRAARGPGGWLVRVGEIVLGLGGLYALWAIFTYGLATFSFAY